MSFNVTPQGLMRGNLASTLNEACFIVTNSRVDVTRELRRHDCQTTDLVVVWIAYNATSAQDYTVISLRLWWNHS